MKWYYAEGGKQVGPVEESVLDDLVRQGVVRDETLVWREGMAAWQRHGAVRGPIPGSPPPRPPAPPFDSQPAPSQRQEATRHYGGFWIRFLAILIDGIIIGVVGAIIRIPLGVAGVGLGLSLGRNPDPSQVLAALPAILSLAGLSGMIQLALSLAYEVYFVSTRGATPGKMALGLKITRADGSPVSAGLAAGRYFGRILSWLTLCIGFIIAGFDGEKRALHDHICGTRVVYARS
jgi:uncharacterized RDD family membrane protein YckC